MGSPGTVNGASTEMSTTHSDANTDDATDDRATVVRRDDERGRYELLVDGEVVGIADFVLRGELVVMPHTEIVRDRRGQGLGAILVQGALDDVRAAGRTVVPACWYVGEFVREHPDYADLIAP
jgi:uncharacterized protein